MKSKPVPVVSQDYIVRDFVSLNLGSGTGCYYVNFLEGKTKAVKKSVSVDPRLLDAELMNFIGCHHKALLFPFANRNPGKVTDLFGSMLGSKTNELVEQVVCDSVRHTFNSRSRSQGLSTVLVQQVVGHEKSGAGVTD